MCCSSHIESVWGCGTQYRGTPLQSRMYSEASSAGPGSAMLPLLLLCQNSSCKVDWCRSLLTSAAQSHCLLQACAGNWPPTLALVQVHWRHAAGDGMSYTLQTCSPQELNSPGLQAMLLQA